ncbi:hypothetical protein C7S16_2632 [Burkholderia thailandensis]|uniref:Uncharacterized protein n=1 Tax=Burkholderia thailandensis TaxID=57975 RepID=A0AAW9D305_BURTH|nr:hypothetical protein [Burkholderia thailandensis]
MCPSCAPVFDRPIGERGSPRIAVPPASRQRILSRAVASRGGRQPSARSRRHRHRAAPAKQTGPPKNQSRHGEP